MDAVYVGTRAGVYRLSNGRLERLGLAEHEISAIHAWENEARTHTVLAGSYESGMFHSDDSGAAWQPANDGLTAPCIRTIQLDPAGNGTILCGTEPARAYRSADGGRTWSELDGITELPGCPDWFLPYSPRAGALRNLYSPAGQPEWLLGAVEVGGLIESRDAGRTWRLLDVGIDDDIHQVTGHPENPELLYLALGWAALPHHRGTGLPLGGVAVSRDGGRTWSKSHSDYTRAVIVPPTHPDLLLAGPAKEVGAEGRIEVSLDQGETWEPASDGIETPMEDMVELFVPAPDGDVWAICSGGRLLQARPGEWRWRSALPSDATVKVRSVSFVYGGGWRE
jgi:photosystem II stability/assembly factor-like uncharacterized protein